MKRRDEEAVALQAALLQVKQKEWDAFKKKIYS
jgi:hypothetical protein